jgi:hypothetical protein
MAQAARARATARREAERAARRARATAATARLLDRKSRLQNEDDGTETGLPGVAAPTVSPARPVVWGNDTSAAPTNPVPPSSPPVRDSSTPTATGAGGYRSRLLDAKRRAAQGEDE